MSSVQAIPINEQQNIVERKQSPSDSSSVLGKTKAEEAGRGASQEDVEENKGHHSWTSYERLRPFILVGLALLILGWWISSIVLPATRHRWCVTF
jgi:CNT family concentrative nucleoside transporter